MFNKRMNSKIIHLKNKYKIDFKFDSIINKLSLNLIYLSRF